jgi:hypothetical protein
VVRLLTAIWLVLAASTAGAEPQALVRLGDPSPLGLRFSRFSDVALGDDGRVAFIGATTAVFRRSGSTLVHVIGAGDTLEGRMLAGVGAHVVGRGGCLAGLVTFVDGGAGIFRGCGGTTELVAETGQAAPEGTYAAFGPDIVLGSDNRVAFTARLGAATALLLADDLGTVRELARTGGVSPAGGTFASLRPLGITVAGQVGFQATVIDGNDGLFYWDGVALAKLVVTADASPAGGSFESIGFTTLNETGVWAFRATVTTGQEGVFRADTSAVLPALTVVALTGQPTPIGGTFRDFPSSLRPGINALGSVAFRASVQEGEFTSAFFLAAAGGTTVKIVATGEATAAGQLSRLRDIVLADDGGVLLGATLIDPGRGGTPGVFSSRSGVIARVALVGDTTDLGGGFRFIDARAADDIEGAHVLGLREGLFIADTSGALETVAAIGDPTPIGGSYTSLDQPAAGPGTRIVFGANIRGARAGEALLTSRRRGPAALVITGRNVKRGGRILDFFAEPLDALTRASVGPGSTAFQAALTGAAASSGLFSRGGRGIAVIALEGQQAPGGGRYRAFGTPAVVRGRQAAFVAEVGDTSALFLKRGARTIPLARAGKDTVTRLGGTFASFGTPATGAGGVVFRATLSGGRDGLFFVRGRQLVALAGRTDMEPGGGRFRLFGTPTTAGASVVFLADVEGGSTSGGVFRVPVATPPEDVAPAVEALAVDGGPSPLGGTFIGFGTPAGNRSGQVAYTADLSGAAAPGAIFIE